MASFPGLTSALSQNYIDRLAGIALVTVLMMGCFAILRPFLSAILWAVILSFFYHRIERAVRGRQGLAAGLIEPLVFLRTSHNKTYW